MSATSHPSGSAATGDELSRDFLSFWSRRIAISLFGLLLLAGLAVAVTAGVQAINLLSQSHGGPQYVDLAGLLYRVGHDPADPAIWWVYFTLFSTMVTPPSLPPASLHGARRNARNGIGSVCLRPTSRMTRRCLSAWRGA